MSARQRLTFAGIAVLIAVIAVIGISVAGGSDDGGSSSREAVTADATPEPTEPAQQQADPGEPTAEPTATPKPKPPVPTVVVEGGEPRGGVKEIEVTQGDQVRFKVVSDVADEVHVHGYDLTKDVSAGGQVSFSFKATITGIFEAELESRAEEIVSLRVDPK